MRRILVVEDDLDIGNLLQEVLESEGYSVTRAYSGTEALLQLSGALRPDLILLDLMLPGVSGEEVLKKAESVPVLVLSARGAEDDKVRLLRNGAADYMTKPFSVRELLARIEVQLRVSAPDRTQACWKNVTCDDRTRTVSVGNTPVHLTPTEHALLSVMLRAPDRVFTKSVLLELTASIVPDGTEASLKTHISNLRRKLRDAGAPSCLQSVWGVGYRIAPD